MLTFEQKQQIIESFPQLVKKEISLKRLNYHFEDSLYEKTIVVEKLHPNGNGFVFVGDLLKYEKEAVKGLVNIRDYSEAQLREVIQDTIDYLGEEEVDEGPIIEIWSSRDGSELELIYNGRSWDVCFQGNLEESFGTRQVAVDYLREDGFRQKK
jgi:hypothetical protein